MRFRERSQVLEYVAAVQGQLPGRSGGRGSTQRLGPGKRIDRCVLGAGRAADRANCVQPAPPRPVDASPATGRRTSEPAGSECGPTSLRNVTQPSPAQQAGPGSATPHSSPGRRIPGSVPVRDSEHPHGPALTSPVATWAALVAQHGL
ncbi:DUF397 domain-containing protein [Streptomyces sp. NPDC001678]|uniref:DUF397 domain-containing protein n=1 Tax=Streptomyces sp. NPDC001678 TaxID=3364599 RepID=UPI0036867289